MTRLRRVGLGAVDQGLSSLSNVLFLVAVARVAGLEEFGAVSLAYAIFAFGLSVQRSSIGLLVSLSARRDMPPPLVLALAWALVVAAAGVMLGATVGDGGSAAFYVIVGACLIIYPQDILRYSAIAEGRVERAVVSDGIWTFMSIGLLLASVVGVPLDVTSMSLVWVIAGAGSALIAMVHAYRAGLASSPRPWFTIHAVELRTLGPDALLASIAPLLLASAIAHYMTLGDVAAVRGAGTLLGPVAVLFSALPAVLLPELARALGNDRSRLAIGQTIVMSLIVLAWGGSLTLLPDDVGAEILGATWEGTSAVLLWVVLELVMWAVATGPIALLSAYRRWRTLLLIRVTYVTMVACVLFVTVSSGDVTRVVMGMFLASVVNCFLVGLASRGLSRDQLPGVPPR